MVMTVVLIAQLSIRLCIPFLPRIYSAQFLNLLRSLYAPLDSCDWLVVRAFSSFMRSFVVLVYECEVLFIQS